jgi:hypothetical protein
MRNAIEKLELLGRELSAADPGDQQQLASVLARRGYWVAELARAIAVDECTAEEAAELLERLQAISDGGGKVYRLVVLQRLLLQQRIAVLRQDCAVLRAFDPGTPPGAGSLMTTAL